MPQIGKALKYDSTFETRKKFLTDKLKRYQKEADRVMLGGGVKAIEKHKTKGKLTARERINLLIDKNSYFLEMGLFTAEGMYADQGGCPSAGTVMGIGSIHGRKCMIVANDATVKAGAWFPITAKKNLRAQEISIENKIPIIYLVDSAGVYLPMQDDIFPDKEHFGRIFRNNAVMSSMGIVQISAIMGPCVAGGAYLPIMSDEALIVEGTGSVFLAGSHLVKAAIGEDIDNESLGGALVHCEISGVTDYKMKDDAECLQTVRNLIEKLGHKTKSGYDRIESKEPLFPAEDLHGIIPETSGKPYDMYEIISRLIDGSEFDEYKAGFGKTIITGYARIDGWSVGIVANQRMVVKSKKGEMQIGGVIYSESADKAARFILNCNQRKIPLVFLQDVTGFMVGSRSEHGGIIKDGAKMVNAVANSVVPKFTFIVGNSYGAGNYAMCGKAYDPRLIYAWPTSQIAVMGGKQASETLMSIKLQAAEKNGKPITDIDRDRMLKEVSDMYNSQLDPMYAAARLWTDGIIDPVETRKIISLGIEVANHQGELPVFNPGVMQT